MTNDELRERMKDSGVVQAHGAFIDYLTILRLLSDSDECAKLRKALEASDALLTAIRTSQEIQNQATIAKFHGWNPSDNEVMKFSNLWKAYDIAREALKGKG